MLAKDQIITNFAEIGIDVNDDVVDKCVQLCINYGLTESDIVDEWMAFTVSNNDDLQITAEALSLMERKSLAKRPDKKVTGGVIKSPLIETISADLMDVDPTQYQRSSNPNENGENFKTPVSNKFRDARVQYTVHSPRSLFSPSSYSPISSVRNKKYDERTNAGEVVCRFGDSCDSSSWKTNLNQPQKIDIAEEFNAIPSTVTFMFETIAERVQACQKYADFVSTDICKSNGIDHTDNINFDSVVETAKYAGRIICDGNGRLNPSSVILNYCLCKKVGKNAKLQLNDLADYSIFPGQVVVIEGKNHTGQQIVVENIYTDVQLPMCPIPKEFTFPREPLQIVISAGPYSLCETMSYQPLMDLAKYIEEHKPHIVILIGPIIDCAHAELNEEKLDSTFPEYFEEILKQFLTTIKSDKLHTKVIVVSHWRESGQRNLYPTPIPRLNSRTISDMPNVQFVPDPCILDVSGFKIGVTGADILMHLGKEELNCSTKPAVDRLGRVASHLLQQKNFYPLMPPAEEMTIDADFLLKYATMPYKPHMLVLPSDLRYFTKNIFGCVVINPEKLSKGQVGGNFARVEVRSAMENEIWSPETHVSVQIVKI